jgi:hypothetical protein
MVVIELLAAELHDVAIAPEVLGMTGAALGGIDAWQAAVEAPVLGNIGPDLLVAVEAQPGLATAVAAVVTLRALLFELGVRRRHLSWHEERLGIHGFSPPCSEEPTDQSEYQRRPTCPSLHVSGQ